MRKSFKLQDLECANCASKMEHDINGLDGINKATINFMASKLILDANAESAEDFEGLLDQAQRICTKYESDCVIVR